MSDEITPQSQFWRSLSKQLFNWVYRVLGLKKRTFYHPIDFDKAWWNPIIKEKQTLTIAFFVRLVLEVVQASLPFFIAWIVSSQSLSVLWIFVTVLTLVALFNLISDHIYSLASATIMNSILVSANKFFMTVDPQHHSTRSSGQIISKVSRTPGAYEGVLDAVMYDFLSLIGGIGLVVTVLWNYNPVLGMIALVSQFIILSNVIFINSYVTKFITKIQVEAEDDLKATTVESLQQVALVRSSFATDGQHTKTIKLGNDLARVNITTWCVYTIIFNFNWLIYIASLAAVGWLTISSLQRGAMDAVSALAIIATFAEVSQRLLFQGGRVSKTISRIREIQDLFEFIRGFGKQTYPVLDSQNPNAIE